MSRSSWRNVSRWWFRRLIAVMMHVVLAFALVWTFPRISERVFIKIFKMFIVYIPSTMYVRIETILTVKEISLTSRWFSLTVCWFFTYFGKYCMEKWYLKSRKMLCGLSWVISSIVRSSPKGEILTDFLTFSSSDLSNLKLHVEKIVCESFWGLLRQGGGSGLFKIAVKVSAGL